MHSQQSHNTFTADYVNVDPTEKHERKRISVKSNSLDESTEDID